MKKLLLAAFLVVACLNIFPLSAKAQGISVDAGMTPAEDRWMYRSMVHFMQRGDDPTMMNRSMNLYAFNNIIAYGIKRDITIILKQPVLYRKMTMSGVSNSDSGLGDTTVMLKYGIYRKNTHSYAFGLATTVGLKLPTGDETFSNDTSDLKPGIYMSLRGDRWGSDLAFSYNWKGISGVNSNDINPGNELSIDWAIAYRNGIGDEGKIAFVPVLELSYKNIDPNQLNDGDLANSGETVMFISPGMKFTVSSLSFEALAQIPVYQEQEGNQLERGTAIIVGAKYMF